MNYQTLLMLTAVALIVMAWYANNSKRNVILCTFNRVNKTQITKWVKMQSRYVIFDKYKFDIVPSRIQFRWWNGGFVHMLFPQWVASLTFSHTSRWPLDPNTMAYSVESPENRNALNKEEWVGSYYRGARPANPKTKAGLFASWLPWVAIGLVGVVAFYFNSKMVGFGHQLDAVVNSINAIK